MKILLTGHRGFVGSHLIEAFKNAGHTVFGYDFKGSPDENISLFGNLLFFMNTVRPDIVCHHAASVSVPVSMVHPNEYWENNVRATANILEAMRIVGTKRIIFASSSSVYGDNAGEMVSEHDVLTSTQLSPYAASKIMCEKLIETYHKCFDIKYINFRYFNLFGKGGRGVISQWSGKTTATQNGNTIRDYTHVSNVCFANLCALEAHSSAWNDVYNIGCGQATSLEDLSILMGVETKQEKALDCDVEICTANIYKAKKYLGYEVITTLEEGLKLI